MLDFTIYSPEEALPDERLEPWGVRLFIKRDDMIHPFVSGNKWRKLRYPLEEAHSLGKTHLVSFGGAFSNHLLALAAAGARFGFRTTGFVRGEETLPLNDTLFLCRQFGMELIYANRERYRERKKELFLEYFGDDPGAFFIDEGGRSPLAAKGCAELPGELTRPYDHLFVPCGTGTTLAGIMAGLAERNMSSTSAEGVAVLKNAAFLEEDIRELSGNDYPFRLHTGHHQGGYARTNQKYMEWLQDFHRRHGVLLDPVYTGKMMFAIFRMTDEGYFRPGSTLLAVHTGGIFGLLGMKDRFDLR